MNEQQNKSEPNDEIGGELETGNEVNEALEQQDDDAAAGIARAPDAAKHEQENETEDDDKSDNHELTGAP